ncbi:MAG TPA: ABC transporter ATP-binding protein [Burkholderiales bacterium]|nr:ABC transporter ATP-binding protein [Burkholderiales bacterium]
MQKNRPDPFPVETPSLVALRGVDKVYSNGVVALKGLDLAVREGELLSLLGPSGCGKSTVLRLIAGLGDLSSGTIEWSNRRGDIGFVFQDPTLMPWATVFGNIYLPLRVRGVPKREAAARIERAMEQVGLAGFGGAYPRELSGGMRMRVSIARSLVAEPKILLMDEPFAALDEITRFKLNDDLLALWASQRWTVVFVTHSVFESVYLSTRILVMSARPGRVAAEVPIAVPAPRDPSFRTSHAYAEHCRIVSAKLAQAMQA